MTSDQTPLLAGRLGPIAVQDLMGFLASVRLSGALFIDTTEGELAVYWTDGVVVWSEPLRGGLAAKELLIESDEIKAADLAAVRETGEDDDIGDLLVRSGRITVDQLDEFRVQLVSENIYRMFEWSPGSFRFLDGEGPPVDVQPMRIEVQGLLLEAARRYDEWSRLPEPYNDPQTRFELLSEPKNSDSIALSLDEWRMLYLVNGCANLAEIWLTTEQPDIEVSRTLYGLATARLIRPLDQESASAELPLSLEDDDRFSGAMDVPSGIEPGDDGTFGTLRFKPGTPLTSSPDGAEVQRPLTGPVTEVRRLSRSQIEVQHVDRLVEVLGDGTVGREITLDETPLLIGRAPDSGLVLANKHVSGRHARILVDGDHFVLEDLGSSNGIRVEGRRVTRAFLRAGNEIEIYPFRFRYERQVAVAETA